MLYALCLSYHSNTEAVLFVCLSFGWTTTTGRLLGPKVGNSIKCLSHGHSDELPHLLARRLLVVQTYAVSCSDVGADVQPRLLGKNFWAKLVRFGRNFGKIKILHPPKHSISYGYGIKCQNPGGVTLPALSSDSRPW